MKKIVSLLMALLIPVCFASCKKNDVLPEESKTNVSEEASESEAAAETTGVETSAEASSDTADASETASTENLSEVQTTAQSDAKDPSEWTDEEIIEYYKAAAKKTSPKVKSNQVMILNELIINDGDGALGFFIKILEPAIASVVEKNAFDFDGITGGFTELTAADAQNIKAYKSGEYTVIEMTMKPQTDPIHADAYAGTVGHAITVLGDISKVLAEFPQFEVDVENADIAIHYINPTVKVRINKDGYIEKGTWKYTCDPEISHLDISGIMIDTADAEIDYVITVGGGF